MASNDSEMPSSGWIRSTSTFGFVHSTGVSRKSVNGARLNCTAISRHRGAAGACRSADRTARRPTASCRRAAAARRRSRCASRRDVRFLAVARRTARARRRGARRLRVSGVHRMEHLDLLVAHVLGREGDRRLHRHQRQQLEHVVLHDVAQRARLVVVRAARSRCRPLRRRSSARGRRSGGSRSARRCRWRTGTPGCSGRSPSRGSDRCGRSAIRAGRLPTARALSARALARS